MTGGAGYVGSVSAEAFLRCGSRRRGRRRPVDRSRGVGSAARRSRCSTGPKRDAPERLAKVMRARRSRRCSTARRASWWAESIADPSTYYRENVGGGLGLLDAAGAAQGRRGWCSRQPRPSTGARTSRPVTEDARPADQPLRRDEAGRRGVAGPERPGVGAAQRGRCGTSTWPARPREARRSTTTPRPT